MRISNGVSNFDVFVADSSAADMDGELVLRYTEMSGSLLRDSLSVCTSACKKYPNSHEKAAKRIKQTMDRRHGSPWHVVVGASFGLEVTHEVRHILYLACDAEPNGMEPCDNEEPKRNYFDIAPLLRQHENKLRREIVQLTIRLDSSSGRKKKHDSKREQKLWEQLRNSILDAQQVGALSYSLPNLELIKQVVLNKRLSSSDVRSMLPEGSVSQADEEVDEGFRTPVSVCASGYASGCSSPQSLKSPKSDAVLADPGTSGRPSSAVPSSSSCTALVQRWRSPDHSPKPSEERKRLVQSPVRIPEAESRSRSPVRQREAGASSEGTAHRYRHSCHSEQDQERQSEAREEESAEIRRSAVTLEEMHASLDRLTRILREIALLINVSPAQRERLGEAHRQRPSRSLASMRISGLTRSISRQHSPSLRESLSLSGSQAPPVRESGHPARPVSSRDTTCVTPSDNEEGRESHRQKGKHPKVRRRQGQHSVPQTHVMLAPRRASENEVVIQSVSAVTSHVPSDFDSASGSEDVSSLSSKSGSDSEISISLEADSGGEERNRVVPKDRPAGTSSRPTSVCSDDERTLLSSQARSPEFFEHPPFLPHDALPADHGAFEAASLREDEDDGRLSPGEVPFSSEGPVPFVEPTFPVLEMQGGGQGRGFRGIARGSCWSDPGHFGSEPLNVENVDDDVDAFRSADDRLPPSGIPLEQGARDEDMSQHIWRWANSETGRVIDEAAMRRLELFKTTYGGNIDGQPPHMVVPGFGPYEHTSRDECLQHQLRSRLNGKRSVQCFRDHGGKFDAREKTTATLREVLSSRKIDQPLSFFYDELR